MAGIPKDEIKRKTFHLLSLVYIFAYWYLPKVIVVWGFIVVIATVVFLEFLRFRVTELNEFFKSNFKGFYRAEEIDKISGLVGTLSGAFAAIVMFQNKCMVLASFLYFSLGDSAAALVGKSVGRHKIFSGKSLEGSSACFFVCFTVGLFIFNWRFALAGALSAAVVEAVIWKINDNFWMQIANAGILTLLANFMVWTK